LTRISHPSGSRLAARSGDRTRRTAPGPVGPQKSFGAMPIPIVCFSDLVVSNQTFCGYRHRRIKFTKMVLDATGFNQTRWVLTNPKKWFAAASRQTI